MSWSNLDIFTDLREAKIYPNSVNSHQTYQLAVQSWLWQKIFLELEYGAKVHCQTLSGWLQSFSLKFKDEVTREWAATNASWKDVVRKYKTYMEHPVEFPG